MTRKTDAEIMAEPHWAIIEIQTTHHEGDARSRSNPGHGYPAHTTSAMVYKPFDTEEEVLDRIRSKPSYQTYTVIYAQPVKIKTEITLSIEGIG